MTNPIVWVEIPVTDMDRAMDFYHRIFGWDVSLHDLGQLKMAMLPSNPNEYGATGALVLNVNYSPSEKMGPLIYFTSEDMDAQLGEVESVGGSILRGKTLIAPGAGYMALILDSEGNRIALRSVD